MSKNLPTRDYRLRQSGKNSKLTAGGSHMTTKCRNCTRLSLENDRLRRQVATLTSQNQDSARKFSVPFSHNGALVADELCDGDSSVPISNVMVDKNSNEIVTEDVSSTVESTNAHKVEVVQSDVCCGTEDFKCDTSDTICGTDDTSVLQSIHGTDQIVHPFNEHSEAIFDMFDTTQLESSTTYSHLFGSRSVAYYGDHPYTYTGGSHPPCSFNNNIYLKTILEAVNHQYPDFEYNSAMVTRYSDGTEWIPLHSDDEKCIASNSLIMTISFGASRVLQFKSKGEATAEADVTLNHGDVLTMTHLSQSYFQHTVPEDQTSCHPRISVTLRKIVAQPPSGKLFPVSNTVIEHPSSEQCTSRKSSSKPLTVYISSSMFSNLDANKLSSQFQDALVFHYPGATASGINQRFHADDNKNNLDVSRITKIILMCGTNDVDVILNSPKHLRNKLLTSGKHPPDPMCLDNTNRNIEKLVLSLHEWAPIAKVNIVNILPRESFSRNQVISDINQFISKLHDNYPFVQTISTEENRYLFANRYGFRKSSLYFSHKGEDNVHLNHAGVIRLAKHLKYHAHII